MELIESVLLTLDVDWAPDFVIDFVAGQLISRGVRATWFVTHLSPAIIRLREHRELFELGVHPNFLPGSAHGDTPKAILRHCMTLLPEAISVRTHALVQSTPLIEQILTQTPIRVDVSLFLPRAPFLRPVEYQRRGRTLLRVPYYWEDDFEMERLEPWWRLAPLLAIGDGLKVFDFHPIHIYLNSADLGPYRLLKSRVPRLPEATPREANACVQKGEGAQTLFAQVIDHLAESGGSRRIEDIYRGWRDSIKE